MVTVKIDYKNLEKSLNEFSKALDKEVETSIVEMAQIGSRQLAHYVQPFGTSNKAKVILETAVYKDVNKAYATIGRTFQDLKNINPRAAAAYIKAIKANDLVKAEGIIEKVLINYTEVKNTDTGDYLQSIRNSKGRVPARQPINLIDNGAIEKIKATVVLKAGLAKAGFLKAGEMIKSKFRIPKWLRNNENIGTGKITGSKNKTVVTITNNVRYASEVISPGNIQKAIRNAYVNQLKKMQRAIDALAKKV